MLVRCPECSTNYDTCQDKCPTCGCKLDAINTLPALNVGTILKDRYYVGPVFDMNEDFIIYRCFDRLNNGEVLIRESFPRDVVSRDEDNPVVAVIKEDKKAVLRAHISKLYKEFEISEMYRGHRNMVSYIEVFEENSLCYLVSEFITGKLLSEYIKNHECFTEYEATVITRDIALAVSSIHKLGMVHNGVDPKNILVIKENKIIRAVLLNTGLSVKIGKEPINSVTDPYMSPDYILKLKEHTINIEPEDDIYALTALYYAVLTATDPVPYKIRMERNIQLSPKRTNPEIPSYIDKVTVKATSLVRKERPVSADEFLGDLNHVLTRIDEDISRGKYEPVNPEFYEKMAEPYKSTDAAVTLIPSEHRRIWKFLERKKIPYTPEAKSTMLKRNLILAGGILLIIAFFSYLYYYANYYMPKSWYNEEYIVTQFVAYRETCDEQVHYSRVKEGCDVLYLYVDTVHNENFSYRINRYESDIVLVRDSNLEDFTNNQHGIPIDCSKLTPGIYEVTISITDELGNITDVGIRYFRIQPRRW